METKVSVPKTPNAFTPTDFRVIALLNTGYKIFARLLASRLRPWIQNITHHGQHRGLDEKPSLMMRRAFGRLPNDKYPVNNSYRSRFV